MEGSRFLSAAQAWHFKDSPKDSGWLGREVGLGSVGIASIGDLRCLIWVISHGSSSPDPAQHSKNNLGNKYGTLPWPFLLCICTSIPHSNCKRLNVIPNLQRRKLSLGGLKSFAPGLIAPKWHGRNSKYLAGDSVSSLMWKNVSSIQSEPSCSQGRASSPLWGSCFLRT